MQEEEVLRLAQLGDHEAINQLVLSHQQSVFGVCYRMLGERREAEDAAQEALVKAITNLNSFDRERPFRPWLLRIASNECIDRIRRQKPSVSLDGMSEDGAWEWLVGDSPNPESEAVKEERRQQLRNALESLPEQDRLIVMLFYWEGLAYAEIEEVTGLTLSAIKSRLFRARRSLAALLMQEEIHVG